MCFSSNLVVKKLVDSDVHGIGTIEEVFQSVVNLPVEMGLYNSSAIPESILAAVDFNILADMPSGPFDFVVSSDIILRTEVFIWAGICI